MCKITIKMYTLLFLLVYSFTVSTIYSQEDLVGMQNTIRYSENTKLPKTIYNVNSRQYSGTPEEIAKKYLKENSNLFGLKDNIDDLKLTEIKESPAGKHVGFKQYYKKLTVFRSETVVSINKQNKISMVVNGYKPNISLGISPKIASEQAILLAKNNIKANNSKELFPSKSELVVYLDSTNTYHLVWKILLFPKERGGEWLVIVEALNGQILERFNTTLDYVNGKGNVFNPDPGTYLNSATLTDQNDADYQALQPAYKTNVTLNDLNDAVGGMYYVRGRYAWSQDILIPNDAIVSESDPDDFTYNRSQNGFEEVNIYYFIDKQRRYIGNLGFSPTWDYLGTNSQTLAFDARGYDPNLGEDNAFYSPNNEYMIFGAPDSYFDTGEDQNLILHEYGHAFHDALMYGGTDYLIYESDTRGVSEGLADYLAISYRRTTQSTPYRPNHRSNWFAPAAGSSILSSTYAKYPTNWTWDDPYAKMKVWASTLMDIEYNDATNPSSGTNLGRDITTKLVLASLSYVTENCDVIDNVNAILQADRDIYNGAHLSNLAAVFYNRGFMYYDYVSGTISSNKTWDGYKYALGDITVNAGVTLTISSNTFLIFANGAKLIINGSLQTNGTQSEPIVIDFASPNSSTQNGIKFNSGSTGSINYATISNARYGVYSESEEVTIANSEILNCTDGIYLLDANSQLYKPVITGNLIHNNSSAGIRTFNSSAKITNNNIYSNSFGVSANTGSDLYFGMLIANMYGHNKIQNNSSGILSSGSSYIYAGAVGSLCSYNIIASNAAFNAVTESSGNIYAVNNWWGSNPPSTSKFLLYGSTFTYQPYLTSMPVFKISTFGGDFDSLSVLNNDNSKKESVLEKIIYANQLLYLKKTDEVIKICSEIVNDYPEDELAPLALNYIYKATGKQDLDLFKSLMNNTKEKNGKTKLAGNASLLLASISKDEEKIPLLDEIIRDYSNSDDVKITALYNKFIYYLNKKEDFAKAEEVAKEISNMSPESYIARDANAILNLGSPYKNLSEEDVDFSTDTFELFENYPNPFNPTTTISYQIPEQGFVTLKVYDMLGREVADLVNNKMEAGKYSVNFNANNLASGIYVYRITVQSFEGSKDFFTQSNKMLFLK